MSVTVVIPHYGPDELLQPCLDSLDEHAVGFGQLVVDANEDGWNFAQACNRGARAATQPWLLFLNNDCRVLPGWGDAMRHAVTSQRKVIGCRLVFPDGRLQHAGVDVVRAPGMAHATEIRTGGDRSCDVDAVTGACLMIRADLFDELGGFDEEFDNGYEDVDLCLRAREATGRRAWYEANASAVHLTSASGEARWRSVNENVRRLSEKWGL